MINIRPTLTGTPVLETERLILRAPVTSDFDAFAAFAGSDRAAHVGGPSNRALAWRGFCHLTGHWVHRGYGYFVFTDKTSGAPLGMSGPWYPEGWPEPEIAWSVWDAAAEGKGFAKEAAIAARAYAYGVLGWTTAISLIDPANSRSAELARRLGAVPEIDTVVMDKPCTIWRHPAPDTLTDGGMEAYA
ncbi:MAG: GNAT family N-acetyltransferase [Gemmobacter sp.]|nr:GNAT family N-acetyltransferase [Gemmobacter sp.]